MTLEKKLTHDEVLQVECLHRELLIAPSVIDSCIQSTLKCARQREVE